MFVEKIRIPEIRSLTDLMTRTRIQELDIQSKNWSIKLRKPIGQPEILPPECHPPLNEIKYEQDDPTLSLILSPSLGIFLPCHPSDKQDMVNVGDVISVNQVIGFLKVGPIYLPVHSPFYGQVKDIYVGHGDLVGFEDKLMLVNQ